jgi:hypothetical protein
MKKEKLFSDIENNLKTFRVHFKNIKKESYKLHPIDVDILKKKTLNIYESLTAIETILKESPEKVEKTFHLPEVTPKGEISEKVTEAEKAIINDEEETEQKIELEIKTTETSEEKTENPEMSETPEPEKEFIPSATITTDMEIKQEKEKVVEEKPIEDPDDLKPEAESQTFQKPDVTFDEKKETTKSTVDLFSDNATVTLGDKLGSKDQSSIADKMQKSQVNDLRQAIGINEKFLFINELFNGDLGRYNRVIDELNELKTQEGINAYLIELKVANQWPDKNDAYLKLKTLLDRKIK